MTIAFREAKGVLTCGLRPTGQLGTPAPGDDQRAEDENHNRAAKEDSMPAETAEECSDDEGMENVTGEEYTEVDKEDVEDEAGDCQGGEEEAGESLHWEQWVGESLRGDEVVEEDGDENEGGEDFAELERSI